MASARAALGRARRGIIKRKKTTDVVTGALGAAATVTAFGAGQAKKAWQAQQNYEAGYKELGGDVADIKKPKFGEKGWFTSTFKGPEGEVSIGEGKDRRTYSREKIQKAGSFLGSDAAAILSPEQRQQYLGRTAPGKLAPGLGTAPATGPHMVAPPSPISGENLMDYKRGNDFSEYVPTKIDPSPQMTYEGIDEPIQETEAGGYGVDPKLRGLSGSQKKILSGIKEWGIPVATAAAGATAGLTGAVVGLGGMALKGITAWEKYNETNKQSLPEGTREMYPSWPEQGPPQLASYADGGDFITNGPQKILVGDNPGGRERVTISPLPSSNDRSSSENRSLLESLYENNRRRKVH